MSTSYTITLEDFASRGFQEFTSTVIGARNVVKQTKADTKGLENGVVQLGNASTQTSGKINSLKDRLDSLKLKRNAAFDEKEITRFNVEIRKSERELKRLENLPPKTFMQRITDMPEVAKRATVAFAGMFAISRVNQFFGEVRDVRAEVQSLDNSIRFSSAGEGQKNLKYIRDEAFRLGLDLQSAREGFRTLAGATRGTVLQGEATRDIFRSVGTAAVAMGLNAEQQKGAFTAIGQIMSKGKVQAEELRGQLSERIPAAFAIAARAMGVTQTELNKMLDDGRLMSDVFLPRFAKELENTYSAGAAANASGLTAEINRQNSAYYKMQATLGQLLEPAYLSVIKVKNTLTQEVINLVGWLQENKDIVGAVATAVAAAGYTWAIYAGAVKIAATRTAILTAYKAAQAAATGNLTMAQWALNVAMSANPVGLVIAGIAALAGGIYYLFQNVEQVRGAITGFWEGAKAAFMGIWDVAKNILGGIGNIIMGIFTWDMDKIKEGLGSLAKGAVAANPIGFMYQYGRQIGEASAKGYNEGVTKHRQKKAEEAASKNNDPSSMLGGESTSATGAGAGGATNLKAGIAGVSGDKNAARNITINIEKIVGIEKVLSNNAKEVVRQLKGQITRVILDDINGLNAAAG